ncbi:hypothetical protein Tco_0123327 [Tanacetum coccineum]
MSLLLKAYDAALDDGAIFVKRFLKNVAHHHALGDGYRDIARHLSCLLPIRRRISVFGLYSSNSRAPHHSCNWRGSPLEEIDIIARGGL